MSKGEELTGGRERTSIQADALEAVIAAVYLDKGIEVANDFILRNFKDVIDNAINEEIILDFKTRLQEFFKKMEKLILFINLVKHEGPPHRRKFFTDLLINNEIMGQGVGFSKKESEQNAAKAALQRLGEIKWKRH